MELIQKNAAALKTLKQHPGVLILCALLDAIFFILYGLFTAPFFKSMENSLLNIMDNVAVEIEQLMQGQTGAGGLIEILFSNTAKQDLIQCIMMALLALMISYVLYCTIQGYCWKLSSHITIKPAVKNHISKFFKINFPSSECVTSG